MQPGVQVGLNYLNSIFRCLTEYMSTLSVLGLRFVFIVFEFVFSVMWHRMLSFI
jgi:hypothetical protein